MDVGGADKQTTSESSLSEISMEDEVAAPATEDVDGPWERDKDPVKVGLETVVAVLLTLVVLEVHDKFVVTAWGGGRTMLGQYWALGFSIFILHSSENSVSYVGER